MPLCGLHGPSDSSGVTALSTLVQQPAAQAGFSLPLKPWRCVGVHGSESEMIGALKE